MLSLSCEVLIPCQNASSGSCQAVPCHSAALGALTAPGCGSDRESKEGKSMQREKATESNAFKQ